MKELFKNKTMFIDNGIELEEVKNIFFKNQETTLWGYDETYNEDKSVSSGFLHYKYGKFYLSKNFFGKEVILLEEFKVFN